MGNGMMKKILIVDDDFITKPFVADVMKSRVAKVLEAHELRKDLESELEQKTIKSYTDALTGLKN